ncbi:restriction endonuclease subunit S [Verrucomicrobiota bacterium]
MKERNKNRLGYKKTKAGWIPEDWGFNKLAALDIAVEDGDRGHHYPKQSEFLESGYCLFLNAGNVTDRGFVFTKTQFINKERDRLLKKGKLKRGDIVITTRGTIGNFSHYDTSISFDHVRINSGMAIIRNGGDNISTGFLNLFFTSSAFRKELCRLTFGSAVPQLTIQLINSFPLVVPPSLPEQEAIAEVLECWDRGIKNYELKIVKKKEVKKGLMQRLLNGKQRLPEFATTECTEEHGKKKDGIPKGWKEVRLGEIGTFSKGKGIAKDQVSETGLPCIRYGQIYTSDDYVKKQFTSFIKLALTPESTRIRQNDLLLAGSGETIDEIGKSIAYMGTDEAYAGGDIIVFTPDKSTARADYLSFYLNTEGRSALRRLGQGQSVVHIYARDLVALFLPLPSLSEQQAIATVLSSADDEITALERKLTALRDQKRFLLNNMVTGTIRLPQFVNTKESNS